MSGSAFGAESTVKTSLHHSASSDLFWEGRAITFSETTNRLDQITQNTNTQVLGVFIPPPTDPLRNHEKYAQQILNLGLPILEIHPDGSYGMPSSAQASDPPAHQYSLSTRHIQAAKQWLSRQSLDAASKPLELKVKIEDDEENLEVRKLELGTAGNILWFIYENENGEQERNNVEFRLPF